MKKKNLCGKQFGKLTVLREGNGKRTSGGHKKVTWICTCSCNPNKEIEVTSGELLNGHTKSCGCWNREKAKLSKFKSRITYDLSGDYGIGYTQKGEEFWFDKEDYELIKNYNWHIHHKYVEAHIPMVYPRRQIMMHRLVMGLADATYDYQTDVDHIKTENKFDNRKQNLRIVNKTQNNTNKVKQKNNKSGYPGVHYDSYKNAWIASISVANKKCKTYQFKTKEEAIQCRKELEEIYYHQYSYHNSQLYADSVNQ